MSKPTKFRTKTTKFQMRVPDDLYRLMVAEATRGDCYLTDVAIRALRAALQPKAKRSAA